MTYDVKQVSVTSRGDCCQDRLDMFSIYVTPVGATNYTQGIQCAQDIPIGLGETLLVDCFAQGRTVWVVVPRRVTLSLCEFKVRAEPSIIKRSVFGDGHYEASSECIKSGQGTACGCGTADTADRVARVH